MLSLYIPVKPGPASNTYSCDWPSCVLAPEPNQWLYYQKGAARGMSSSGFPGNQESPPDVNSPMTGHLPLPISKDCCHVLPTIHSTPGRDVAQDLASDRSLPHPLKPLTSVADSGLFVQSWNWASIGLVGLQGATQHLACCRITSSVTPTHAELG